MGASYIKLVTAWPEIPHPRDRRLDRFRAENQMSFNIAHGAPDQRAPPGGRPSEPYPGRARLLPIPLGGAGRQVKRSHFTGN